MVIQDHQEASMLAVLKNYINSEKAVASAVVLIIAAIFVGTGEIDVQQWLDLAKYVLTVYVAGKTVQGAAAALGNGKSADAALKALQAKVAENDAAADAAAEAKPSE